MDKPNPLDYEWSADGDIAYQVDLQRWLQEQQEKASSQQEEGTQNE